MQAIAPLNEVKDILKEQGGEIAKLCYQCGTCTAACPWNQVKSFVVRHLMHEAQLGLVDFEGDDMWQCATCRACVERCPRGVEIIDIMRSLRRVNTEFGAGKVPDSLRISIKNITGVGNPIGESREKRNDWARGLNVRTFTKGMEVLYVPCCTPSYDPKLQKVAQATAAILQKAGVDFGILGTELSCCGESARKAGSETLFQNLAQSNINAFFEAGVKKIVVTSPHCYETFKKEYPALGGNFEIAHVTQFLAELIKDGRLKPTKALNTRITYHDPCYLGRHNKIYDEPRAILKSIPGVELVEMVNTGEDSLCCGGGGGRIWMESKKGERLCDLRLDQALETGASTLVTACPYCICNFQDSVLSLSKEDAIQIKDVAELVLEAI